MNCSDLIWEGKSQKCHFFVNDIGGILVSGVSAVCLAVVLETWRGTIMEYLILLFLLAIIFHEMIGKFLIRLYYSKFARYKIYDERIVIILEIGKFKYIREFLLEDISSIKVIEYKAGIGSIHFGDAETKYWDAWLGKYEGITGTASVTTIGLLRKNNKWHSGILYSIEDVWKVYKIILNLL